MTMMCSLNVVGLSCVKYVVVLYMRCSHEYDDSVMELLDFIH